jgi:hypothetical protein
MTKKNKTMILICAALLIGAYVGRNMYLRTMSAAMARQYTSQLKKPAPVEKAPDPLAAEAAAMGNLSGVWEGRGRVPGPRGLCDLRLELKQNEPGHYSGYSRFSCISMEPLTNPKDINAATNIVNHLNPEAAILTGTVEKGGIHLKTDKAIGTDISGCAVTELTVTPFGATALAAEWLEGTCPGGNLMMQRAVR